MSRTVAVIWHASFSILAVAGYFFFVIPRWWELSGEWSTTLGLIMRIVTGVVVGLAALPVVFTWLRTRRPEYGTPQLALRLRVCSIALHVLAGVLIVGTAISEIWFKLDDVGEWLFGIYGAAAAIFLLGIFSFYLAFVAELPPPPPRPLKKRERKSRRKRRKEAAEDTEEAADDGDETEEDEDAASETEEEQTPVTVEKSDDEAAAAEEPDGDQTPTSDETPKPEDEAPAAEDTLAEEPARGGIRNRRPAGKIRRPRRFRKSDGTVAVED